MLGRTRILIQHHCVTIHVTVMVTVTIHHAMMVNVTVHMSIHHASRMGGVVVDCAALRNTAAN
jgi:hypothetical protein